MAAVESHEPEAIAERTDVPKRTVKAACQYLTVHETGMARDAPGLFQVTSESGREYTVDLYEETCSCKDYEFREPAGGCKHIRRCRLALGIDDVPAAIPDADVDPQLGDHVDGDNWRVDR